VASGDIRKGSIIELNDKLYQIVDLQHIKMKRTALLRVKLRDIRGGHTTEQTLRSDEKLIKVRLDSRSMQYLYDDNGLYHLMDEETFEQITVNKDILGDGINYLKEGISLNVSSYKDEIIRVEMPITVELKVTGTDPGFKGDTATGGSKPATLETGLTIQVPLFVNTGDMIKVDTRNGTYLERTR
jgi:elongation factor P